MIYNNKDKNNKKNNNDNDNDDNNDNDIHANNNHNHVNNNKNSNPASLFRIWTAADQGSPRLTQLPFQGAPSAKICNTSRSRRAGDPSFRGFDPNFLGADPEAPWSWKSTRRVGWILEELTRSVGDVSVKEFCEYGDHLRRVDI